jgi:hypothetical protein
VRGYKPSPASGLLAIRVYDNAILSDSNFAENESRTDGYIVLHGFTIFLLFEYMIAAEKGEFRRLSLAVITHPFGAHSGCSNFDCMTV